MGRSGADLGAELGVLHPSQLPTAPYLSPTFGWNRGLHSIDRTIWSMQHRALERKNKSERHFVAGWRAGNMQMLEF